jgi:hypothetical protein
MSIENAIPRGDSEILIAEIAQRLSEIRRGRDAVADEKSWEMATLYSLDFHLIAEAIHREIGVRPSPQQVNRRIRSVANYEGPGGSWLSHAKRTYEVFEDVFSVAGNKKLPFDAYRHIANAAIPERTKIELRTWAEKNQPKRAELRERINGLVAGLRPDFDLKFTNEWKFSRKLEGAEFDGGIHPDLVANLIYYFTDPGDTILDPMAGGDTTHRVLQKFEFFHAINPALDQSGPRHLIRSDIEPISPGIRRADVREIDTVVESGSIDFCLLDPPYWRIAEGKYGIFGDTIEEWRANIGHALRAIRRTLKPGGTIAVIIEDLLRRSTHEFQPLGSFCLEEATAAGYTRQGTIYNLLPNAVTTMDAKQMWRCKKARQMVNGIKLIHILTSEH